MERTADRKRKCSLSSSLFRKLDGFFNARLLAGDNNLPRRIEVCWLNNARLGRCFTNLDDLLVVQTQHGRHAPLPGRNRGFHKFAATAHKAHCISEINCIRSN